MGNYYFNVSHRGSNIPEDENVFFDNLDNQGWSNKEGIALILVDQAATKVLKGFFRVNIEGGTPSDAFLKILCAVNSTSTSNLAFYFRYRNVDATEDADSASWDETLSNQTVAGPATAKQLIEKSIDLTHGNFADGDLCEFEFGMDGANHAIAADIVVADATVQIDT